MGVVKKKRASMGPISSRLPRGWAFSSFFGLFRVSFFWCQSENADRPQPGVRERPGGKRGKKTRPVRHLERGARESRPRRIGRTGTGKVFEQTLWLENESGELLPLRSGRTRIAAPAIGRQRPPGAVLQTPSRPQEAQTAARSFRHGRTY